MNTIQERQLGLVYSAAFGLSSVASDVIELARGGDRLVDLDPIPFSVTDILESVRDINALKSAEQEIATGIVDGTNVLAVPASSPHKSLADVLAYQKANPGKTLTTTKEQDGEHHGHQRHEQHGEQRGVEVGQLRRGVVDVAARGVTQRLGRCAGGHCRSAAGRLGARPEVR